MRTWWPKPQRDVWIRSLAGTRCGERPLMGSNGFGKRPLLVTSRAHHFWLEFWSFTNFSKHSCVYKDEWSRHLDRKDMIDSDLWMMFHWSLNKTFWQTKNSDNINHHSDFVAFNTLQEVQRVLHVLARRNKPNVWVAQGWYTDIGNPKVVLGKSRYR